MRRWVGVVLLAGCAGASSTTVVPSGNRDGRIAICLEPPPLTLARARLGQVCRRVTPMEGAAALPDGLDLDYGIGCVEAYYMGPDFPGMYPMFNGALRELTAKFPSLRYASMAGGAFVLTTPSGTMKLEPAEDSDQLTRELILVATRVRRDLPPTELAISPEHVLLDGALRSLAWPGSLYGGKTSRPAEAKQEQKNETSVRPDGIVYVKVANLVPGSTDSLHKAILSAPNPRGVVLDLRGSSGGMLKESIELADLFLTAGCIAILRSSTTQSKIASRRWSDIDASLIVLVDKATASGCEVIAGALQANERAVIVGERTVGAGLVKVFYSLPGGASVGIGIGQLFHPDGQPIQGIGIEPDLPFPAGDVMEWAAGIFGRSQGNTRSDLLGASASR